MRRLNFGRCTAVLLVAALLVSCASSASSSALQKAELAYVEASIAFDAAADLVVTARAQGRNVISDANWAIFDSAQKKVASSAPLVRAMLVSWRASNVQPAGFEMALANLTSASNAATAVAKGVTP